MNRLAIFFHLFSGIWAQSYLPNPSFANSSASNTCLKRSVIVYTSETSTYIVTDLGSTGYPTAPTICANASTSIIHDTTTIYGVNSTVTTSLKAETVTIYQTPLPNGGQTTADNGFEDGLEALFNSSTSGVVSAEVATAGPLQPRTGNSYLLITFGQPISAAGKRQAAQPSVYNVTQIFAAAAGTAYRLSAFAAFAPNGNAPPSCSITICAETACSDPASLSASYSPYTYTYTAQSSNANALATFAIQCSGSAYVALDDINVATTSISSP